MKRALAPSLNPTGLGSAAAAVYAAVVMIFNAAHHHGVIDPQVIIAALAAAWLLYTRLKVTPVADPRDGNGQPLTAVPPGAAIVNVPALPAAAGIRNRTPGADVSPLPDPPMQDLPGPVPLPQPGGPAS